MRYAYQENSLISEDSPEVFRKLLNLFNSENLDELQKNLERLSQKYPLLLSPVLQSSLTTAYFKQAEELHQRLCSGCHSGAFAEMALPALDLFRQSRSMSRMEVYRQNFDWTSWQSAYFFGKPFYRHRTFCTDRLLQNRCSRGNKLTEILVIPINFTVN